NCPKGLGACSPPRCSRPPNQATSLAWAPSSPHDHGVVVPARHAYSQRASSGTTYWRPSCSLSQRQNAWASLSVMRTTGLASSAAYLGFFHTSSGRCSNFLMLSFQVLPPLPLASASVT